MHWSDRWLAFATDTPKGILGKSTNMPSANAAEASALKDCKEQGGTECDITLSMSNGCGALAVGHKVLTTGHSISAEEAEKAAMKKCSQQDTSCSVLSSLCSFAEQAN
jgi:hypothetical protein